MKPKDKKKLVKFQEEIYEKAKTQKEYLVQIKHNDKKLIEEVAKIGIPRDKITLRFLRKGLFTKRVTASFATTSEQASLVYGGGDIPEAKYAHLKWDKKLGDISPYFFNLMPTTLNEGYLYLIEAGKTYRMLEFQVKDGGELHPVSWPKGRIDPNKREVSRKSTREIQVVPGTRFHIAYSRTQWPAEKIEKLVKTTTGRSKLLTIYCDGRESRSDDIDHVPYTELVAQFAPFYGPQLYGHYLKKKLEIIAIDETRSASTNLKEDRFVIVDDILGCALDVQKEVEYQANILNLTVESIKRGQRVSSLEKKTSLGKSLEAPKKNNKGVNDMVLLANSLYQMLYSGSKSSNRMKKEFGADISKKVLKKILGINKRKNVRNWLHTTRRDLYEIINSDFLNKGAKYDDSWSAAQASDIEEVMVMLTNTYLSSDPYFIDSSLVTGENGRNRYNQDFNKKVVSKFANFVKGIDIPTNSKKIHEQFAAGVDWTGKIYGIAGKYMEMTALIIEHKIPIGGTFSFDGTIDWSVDRLNSLGIGSGSSKFVVGNVAANDFRVYSDLKSKGILLKTKSTIKIPFVEFVDGGADTVLTQRLDSSKSWKNLGVVLNTMNLGFTTYKMIHDPNWKAFASTGTSFIDFSGDILKIADARNALGKQASKWMILGKRVRLGGALVGFGLSAYDAYGSYEKGDHDAAALQAGAAVAFGASALLGVGEVALFLGPFGWAMIGIGLVILSIFALDDSELEIFFKNTAFSKQTLAIQNLARMKIGKKKYDAKMPFSMKFYKEIQRLGKRTDWKETRKRLDFERALVDLTEMLMVPKIELKSKRIENELKTREDSFWSFPKFTFSGDIAEIEFSIGIGQFLYDEGQIDLQFYFFENGLGPGNGEDMNFHTKDLKRVFVKGNRKHQPMVKIRFTVPNKFIERYTEDSKIGIICRVILGPGKYYPYSLNNQERFIGVAAKARIHEHNIIDEKPMLSEKMLNGKEDGIDTYLGLLGKKKW